LLPVFDERGTLLDEYPGDERFEDLLGACAFYAPGRGSPYLGRAETQAVIRAALEVTAPGT
jgi:hypothetical protein